MHDYQLERLNTRSFEQLVQALGIEITGKQLTIFGDGPDGGREATFQGQVKYPEGKKQWNGYGIVQAKFRQQPESVAKKNADWAIEQLKAEFSNLKPRPKRKKAPIHGERVCPDYYVFATNLALSPVAKKGGKDRVHTVLDGFKKSHGLRDYAVWDGDQIRRFLDTQPAIRMTYAAWLLSGDVLAAMVEHLELSKTDFASTIRRYLESELLDDQYARLGQGGYTDANAIPLASVFVDLPVEPAGAGPPDPATPAVAGKRGAVADKPGRRKQDRPTVLNLLFEEGRQVLRPSASSRQGPGRPRSQWAPGRVVLIGGPGQGKTTAGQFACQLLRAALLRATSASYSPEVAQALERIEKESSDSRMVHVLRYPIRVDLKRLAESLAGEGDHAANSLFEYLVRHISKRTDSDLSKQEFRTWLRSYPWLLVLDGLDEVPASSNRASLMEAIRNFVSVEAHQQDADLLILATTRPQGYSDEFDPRFYRHLTLASLRPDEALGYGCKLAQARHPGLKTRVEQLTSSLKRATANPATVILMESPLQVTIMLALIEGGGEPPEQRWKLFHDYYDVIYRREKERNTPFSALLGKYEPDIHWLHHRAGWVLQQRNAVEGTTAARLSHAEFAGMVDARLLYRGHKDADHRRDLVRQIRAAATDRLVFLVGNTAREIGFEIRSLQEFMAAEHFFDGAEACAQDSIRAIAPHSYWRNVFLFAAGRIFFEKESLIDSLIAVCERLNETLNDQAQGSIAAGSRLALSMLEDGIARNQPENSRLLARCASRLLDAEDPHEGPSLAQLFMSEASEVWREELSRRLSDPGTRFPHISWRLWLELLQFKDAWAEKLARTPFPWRHREVSDFLLYTMRGLESIPPGFLDDFEKHVFLLPPRACLRLLWSWRNFNFRDHISLNILREFLDLGTDDCARLLNEHGLPTFNELAHCGPAHLETWRSVRIPSVELGDTHPAWRMYHWISEFARDCSRAGLGKQLALMAEADPLLEDDWLESFFPWQILACLEGKQAGIPLSKVARAVGSGALGDAADWTRWSEAASAGVKISELGYPNGLVSASDGHLGAMYAYPAWRHTGAASEEYFEFARALADSLPCLQPESSVVGRLVDVCGIGLLRANRDWRPDDAAAVRRLIEGGRDLRVPATRGILLALMLSSLCTEEKTDLLAVVGTRVAGGSAWRHFHDPKSSAAELESCCRQTVAALGETDAPYEVLGALSFLPPLPFAKAIPEAFLKQCSYHDECHRRAAIVLRINRLDWDGNVDQVATGVLSVRATYPEHLSELLDFIDGQGARGADFEAFLLALLKSNRAELNLPLRAKISRLLVRLVERRPAVGSLPDPSVLTKER